MSSELFNPSQPPHHSQPYHFQPTDASKSTTTLSSSAGMSSTSMASPFPAHPTRGGTNKLIAAPSATATSTSSTIGRQNIMMNRGDNMGFLDTNADREVVDGIEFISFETEKLLEEFTKADEERLDRLRALRDEKNKNRSATVSSPAALLATSRAAEKLSQVTDPAVKSAFVSEELETFLSSHAHVDFKFIKPPMITTQAIRQQQLYGGKDTSSLSYPQVSKSLKTSSSQSGGTAKKASISEKIWKTPGFQNAFSAYTSSLKSSQGSSSSASLGTPGQGGHKGSSTSLHSKKHGSHSSTKKVKSSSQETGNWEAGVSDLFPPEFVYCQDTSEEGIIRETCWPKNSSRLSEEHLEFLFREYNATARDAFRVAILEPYAGSFEMDEAYAKMSVGALHKSCERRSSTSSASTNNQSNLKASIKTEPASPPPPSVAAGDAVPADADDPEDGSTRGSGDVPQPPKKKKRTSESDSAHITSPFINMSTRSKRDIRLPARYHESCLSYGNKMDSWFIPDLDAQPAKPKPENVRKEYIKEQRRLQKAQRQRSLTTSGPNAQGSSSKSPANATTHIWSKVIEYQKTLSRKKSVDMPSSSSSAIDPEDANEMMIHGDYDSEASSSSKSLLPSHVYGNSALTSQAQGLVRTKRKYTKRHPKWHTDYSGFRAIAPYPPAMRDAGLQNRCSPSATSTISDTSLNASFNSSFEQMTPYTVYPNVQKSSSHGTSMLARPPTLHPKKEPSSARGSPAPSSPPSLTPQTACSMNQLSGSCSYNPGSKRNPMGFSSSASSSHTSHFDEDSSKLQFTRKPSIGKGFIRLEPVGNGNEEVENFQSTYMRNNLLQDVGRSQAFGNLNSQLSVGPNHGSTATSKEAIRERFSKSPNKSTLMTRFKDLWEAVNPQVRNRLDAESKCLGLGTNGTIPRKPSGSMTNGHHIEAKRESTTDVSTDSLECENSNLEPDVVDEGDDDEGDEMDASLSLESQELIKDTIETIHKLEKRNSQLTFIKKLLDAWNHKLTICHSVATKGENPEAAGVIEGVLQKYRESLCYRIGAALDQRKKEWQQNLAAIKTPISTSSHQSPSSELASAPSAPALEST